MSTCKQPKASSRVTSSFLLERWLQDYADPDPGQQRARQQMLDFLASSPEVFRRTHLVGHFTGSALVCDWDFQKVALLHHRKLNKWLQFGGHADGEVDLADVARREAEEESGLGQLVFVQESPFDLDIHTIPGRPGEPEHLHYDVRFLLRCPWQELQGNSESHQVGWFSFEEAALLTEEVSMLRQFDKARRWGGNH
jgi:8-oxo-dGTP pyrophosphatase MutT (NUDIX family)